MTESPAVFRNARYEARLAFHEQRIAALEGLTFQLTKGLDHMIKAVESLSLALQSRDEIPGEWKPEPARRSN